MPRTIVDTGFLRMTVRYVRPFRDILYYYRRVPRDVHEQLAGKTWRNVSLRTRDMAEAAKKAAVLARQDDAYWKSLRSPEMQRPGAVTEETRVPRFRDQGAGGCQPS